METLKLFCKNVINRTLNAFDWLIITGSILLGFLTWFGFLALCFHDMINLTLRQQVCAAIGWFIGWCPLLIPMTPWASNFFRRCKLHTKTGDRESLLCWIVFSGISYFIGHFLFGLNACFLAAVGFGSAVIWIPVIGLLLIWGVLFNFKKLSHFTNKYKNLLNKLGRVFDIFIVLSLIFLCLINILSA